MEEMVQKLNAEQKKLQGMVFVLIGILVAAAVTAFFRQMPVSFALALAAVLFRLLVFRSQEKRYEKLVNDENLSLTVCRTLKDSSLDSQGGAGLTAEDIARAELLPHFVAGKSSFGAYKGVSGRDGSVKVVAADVALNDLYRKSGGQKRGFVNCGCWIRLTLPESQYNFRVLGDGMLSVYLREDFETRFPAMKRIPSNRVPLPDTLSLYAETENLPGEDFFRKLKNLSEYTPAELWLSVRGGEMHVYLRDRFLAMPVNSREPVTRESLLFDPLPELKRILDLAAALQT